MGNCNSETNSELNISNIIEKPIIFSHEEIQIIRSAWANVTDQKEFSIKLMISLFQTFPEVRLKFIFALGLETEADMRANSQLIYHGSAILVIIDGLIKNFESVNSNEFSDVIALGSNHFHYGVKYQNFKVNTYNFPFICQLNNV
jgi:hypothetical protein